MNPNNIDIVELSDEERSNLKLLTLHPGYPALLKLLEGEGTRATARVIALNTQTSDEIVNTVKEARGVHIAVGNVKKILDTFATSVTQPDNTESSYFNS